jgi:2-keto-4-pentenoate hydratase
MTSEFPIESIARQVKTAQDSGLQIVPLSSRYPGFDMPAAYAVANLVHQARLAEAAVAVGRKIGFTNAAMWARYGVREPVWGHVYDRTLVHLAAGGAVCSLQGFAEPKIEPEIVFHLRCAPPLGADMAAVLDCIDGVAHGFEIVQSHYPGWRFEAADTVADGGLHARLLVGEVRAPQALGSGIMKALETFTVTLLCDGQVREQGRGSNVLGHPLAAVAHLIAVLAVQPQCCPVRAGEWITTGTITGAHAVLAGQTWRTEIDGIALPGLVLRFTD